MRIDNPEAMGVGHKNLFEGEAQCEIRTASENREAILWNM
jgi:hypothetical protein